MVSSVRALGQGPSLVLTNPAPAAAGFGFNVTAVGDSLLVADHRSGVGFAGAVYLFSADGAIKRTLNNPTPANGYFFGHSLTAVGNDKVLIGAPLASPPPAGHPGAAYLFHTNGALIGTFLRPTSQPGARFGISVAALGEDRILIGADGDARGAVEGGAAYLFATNGTLLAILTNPVPVAGEVFGNAVAVLGSDRLLVGAPGNGDYPGQAFLFSTNGSLLATFTNPIPSTAGFGGAVATLGTNSLAIAAPRANIMAPGSGEVYLFRTNGVLAGPALGNPDASPNANFGVSLASVGTDLLLVGSYGGQTNGAAYLFSAAGALLMKFPSPSTNADWFGFRLATISPQRVLIGAWQTAPAGAAYVFDLRPSLDVSRTATNATRISWSSSWTVWTLQRTTNLHGSDWIGASEAVVDDGTNKFIIHPAPMGNQFYRLSNP